MRLHISASSQVSECQAPSFSLRLCCRSKKMEVKECFKHKSNLKQRLGLRTFKCSREISINRRHKLDAEVEKACKVLIITDQPNTETCVTPVKRRARRKTIRCWPRQSANQPAIGFPTIPPKGSTVIGGNVSLELAFTVLMSFYVFWPAKTMPTPKGLMPSCLARIGRKGVTGAAAAKMRKKWPCVVGKCPK